MAETDTVWETVTIVTVTGKESALMKVHNDIMMSLDNGDQGRSQDFSVGTHSFPSHLFTPPPPPPKKKIKVIFDSRVFYFKYININIFEIYFFIYFFILFIYLFIFLFFYYYFQVRNCVFAYR